jgi:hypothetical protein
MKVTTKYNHQPESSIITSAHVHTNEKLKEKKKQQEEEHLQIVALHKDFQCALLSKVYSFRTLQEPLSIHQSEDKFVT